MSNSLWPHGLQHDRPPCPSLSPRVCLSSCPLNRWCYSTISSSAVLFSFCLQSSPASGSFPISWLFTSGGQSIGALPSASVLPMSIQGWFPLGLTGSISLLLKELSAESTLLLLLLLSRFSRVRLCSTQRRQPIRLPRPWDSPGKNTGVGCHFLLQCRKVKSESEIDQSCPTPIDYQAPLSMGFSSQEYWSRLPLPSPETTRNWRTGGLITTGWKLPGVPLWHHSNKEGEAAAAAAKSFQSCPTLFDPRDGSPSGSPVPGILQERTLEWVAISFSSAWKWKVKVKSLSCVQLLATPWTAAYQTPPSMGFSRQEYWSGVPLPSPETTLNWRKGGLITTGWKLPGVPLWHHSNKEGEETHWIYRKGIC